MFVGEVGLRVYAVALQVYWGRGTPGAFGVMQSSVSIVTDPGADFVS